MCRVDVTVSLRPGGRARCFHGRRLIRGAMRHHWLLLGACGWVLLILMFVSKFINFRAVDGKMMLRTVMPGRGRRWRKCDHLVLICVSRLRGEDRCSKLDGTGNQGGSSRSRVQTGKAKAVRSGELFGFIKETTLTNEMYKQCEVSGHHKPSLTVFMFQIEVS